MKATCTWGTGPDVIVELGDDVPILDTSFGLSIDEAEELASQLTTAAEEARAQQKEHEEWTDQRKAVSEDFNIHS